MNKFRELSKLFQWFKELLKGEDLVVLNIEGRKYYVTQECSEFLNMRSVRESFQQVLEINETLKFPEDHQVFKLFFILLS